MHSSPTPLSESPATPVNATVLPPSLIARQPIVDALHTVVAYELYDRSTAANAHDVASDISMVFNAMNDTGNDSVWGKTDIFINRTHQSLVDGHLDLVRPDKVVLEIGPVEGHLPASIAALASTLSELKSRGFRLAFNYTVVATAYAAWQPLADYVKLDLSVLSMDRLKALVVAVKARTPAKVVATKVETQEQFSVMAEHGAGLFQGYWVARPDVVKTKLVTPAQANVLQLFNLVRKEASTDEIEMVLKRDPMLGFNLLRLINSAGVGLAQQVTSFRHAVMLLGLKRLFRWTALLLTAARASGSPPVVGTTAVVRGRMMELLGAGTLTQEESDGAFLVGIFSLLDDMLGMPMEQGLALLSLPEPVADALRTGSGVYGRMLAIVRASETYDEVTFAAAAVALHYTNHHVNMAHMEALIWADGLAM